MTERSGVTIEASLHSSEVEGVVRMKVRYATGIDDLWSALTTPARLARWYGKIDGDLRLGGVFTAFVPASGWDGRGRIEACDPPRQLRLTMWEEESSKGAVAAELVADGDHTVLLFEKRGIPLDLPWAFGAGWQAHFEDLEAHLVGADRADLAARWNERFDELEPYFRKMTVVPLER
jgi:uncharacterized protein YndB with AHSA1/START domain